MSFHEMLDAFLRTTEGRPGTSLQVGARGGPKGGWVFIAGPSGSVTGRHPQCIAIQRKDGSINLNHQDLANALGARPRLSAGMKMGGWKWELPPQALKAFGSPDDAVRAVIKAFRKYGLAW